MTIKSSINRTIPLLLVCLSALLQFWALDQQSLWYDEGFSVWLSQKPVREIVEITAADIQPPLYYVLLHGWIELTGTTEWALRFLSAFFAVLGVPLMWQVAYRMLHHPIAAHISASWVAISPLWLWYGRELRNYSLGLALLLAAVLFLLPLLTRSDKTALTPRPPLPIIGEGEKRNSSLLLLLYHHRRWHRYQGWLGDGYTDWEGRFSSVNRLKHAIIFALFVTLGLYTHYFISFVIFAWGLVALLWWVRQPQRATFWALAVAFGLPLLLLLPWVSIILSRLEEDRSYWEGKLAIWEVIEKTIASWVVGHSVHENIALWLGNVGLVLALVGLLLLFWRAWRNNSKSDITSLVRVNIPSIAKHPYPCGTGSGNKLNRTPPEPVEGGIIRIRVLLIAFWLVIPFVIFIAVAWNRPKFNPRYLIFASPAFFLCLSGLTANLWAHKQVGRKLAMIAFVLVSAVFVWADWNMFNDYAFAKANWRGVTEHLAQHRTADEPILLVSGHTYPIFHYYYPAQDNIFRLPDERTLDTTAVLGLDSASILSDALENSEDVWLVKWQNRVVDPDGVLSALLKASGAEQKETPFFMDVTLERWELPAQAEFESALQPTYPLNVRFGDALRLLGWSDLPIALPADEGLSLVLYWAAERELEGDYKTRLTVVDEAGFEYGVFDKRPTSYYYPTFRWQAGDTRLATLNINLQPGTPAGQYWIDLSVYREDEGTNLDILNEVSAPIGQTTRLGPITVAPAATGWPTEPLPERAQPIQQALLEQQLLAVQLPETTDVEPSQRLPFTFWWQTSGPLPGATLHIGWQQGDMIVESMPQRLANTTWTGEKWRADDLLMTPFMSRVPRHLQAGESDVLIWISDAQGRQSESITLTTLNIAQTDYIFDAPTPAIMQDATFGNAIRLLGYDLTKQNADNSPVLTLYWQVLTEIPQNLTVFAHLLDTDGAIVPNGGEDKTPLDGIRPTDTWVAGEYLSDTFTLTPPEDRRNGPYTIEIGWYNAQYPTFPRLPVLGEGADEAQRRVLLGMKAH